MTDVNRLREGNVVAIHKLIVEVEVEKGSPATPEMKNDCWTKAKQWEEMKFRKFNGVAGQEYMKVVQDKIDLLTDLLRQERERKGITQREHHIPSHRIPQPYTSAPVHQPQQTTQRPPQQQSYAHQNHPRSQLPPQSQNYGNQNEEYAYDQQMRSQHHTQQQQLRELQPMPRQRSPVMNNATHQNQRHDYNSMGHQPQQHVQHQNANYSQGYHQPQHRQQMETHQQHQHVQQPVQNHQPIQVQQPQMRQQPPAYDQRREDPYANHQNINQIDVEDARYEAKYNDVKMQMRERTMQRIVRLRNILKDKVGQTMQQANSDPSRQEQARRYHQFLKVLSEAERCLSENGPPPEGFRQGLAKLEKYYRLIKATETKIMGRVEAFQQPPPQHQQQQQAGYMQGQNQAPVQDPIRHQNHYSQPPPVQPQRLDPLPQQQARSQMNHQQGHGGYMQQQPQRDMNHQMQSQRDLNHQMQQPRQQVAQHQIPPQNPYSRPPVHQQQQQQHHQVQRQVDPIIRQQPPVQRAAPPQPYHQVQARAAASNPRPVVVPQTMGNMTPLNTVQRQPMSPVVSVQSPKQLKRSPSQSSKTEKNGLQRKTSTGRSTPAQARQIMRDTVTVGVPQTSPNTVLGKRPAPATIELDLEPVKKPKQVSPSSAFSYESHQHVGSPSGTIPAVGSPKYTSPRQPQRFGGKSLQRMMQKTEGATPPASPNGVPQSGAKSPGNHLNSSVPEVVNLEVEIEDVKPEFKKEASKNGHPTPPQANESEMKDELDFTELKASIAKKSKIVEFFEQRNKQPSSERKAIDWDFAAKAANDVLVDIDKLF